MNPSPTANDPPRCPEHATVQLDGRRYVMLRGDHFDALCERAGIPPASTAIPTSDLEGLRSFEMDRDTLAARLRRRRQQVGLTQAELAARAGLYAESLSRIERGRTDPDFATIRKLVVAMNAATLAD